MGKTVWAARPFQYAALILDRGQVFELQGTRNDEKLLAFGYIKELERDTELYECNRCPGQFIGMRERATHADKRHPMVPLTVEEEERMFDREERMLMQIAPVGPPSTS